MDDRDQPEPAFIVDNCHSVLPVPKPLHTILFPFVFCYGSIMLV